MRWLPGTLVILLGAVALAAACARPPAFASFTSERQKFSIAYPRGWEIVPGAGDAPVSVLPPGAGGPPQSAVEFLLVLTDAQPGPLSDDEARQLGLNLLPIHGVSGFRRFKEEQGAVWHRFEVTGTSRGPEGASVGLLGAGKQASPP